MLDAAERLFAAHGYQKTTMEDVASTAHVSRQLVYRYFNDKEELFEAVIDRVLREWHETLAAEAARATESTAHTLRRMFTVCLEFAQGRTVVRGLLARDAGLVLTSYSGASGRGRDLLRDVVRDILADGAKRGDVRADLALDDLTDVITEIFSTYSDHIVTGEITSVSARRVEAIIETILHGIVAPTLRDSSKEES